MKKLVMYDNPTVEAEILKFVNQHVGDYGSLSSEDKCTIIKKLECSCSSCGLHYSTPYRSVSDILNPGCDFIFIGRNPNGTEAKANSLFPEGTQQGELFKKYLSMLGIGQSEMSAVNMCCCYAHGNRPPTQEEIHKCIAFKKFELDAIGTNVKALFPMGQDSLKWLYGLNHPGSLQCHGDIYISELNGKKVMVVPLFHPSHVLIEKGLAAPEAEFLKYLRPFVQKCKENDFEWIEEAIEKRSSDHK